jgi:Domain of unknown function (DUF6316)
MGVQQNIMTNKRKDDLQPKTWFRTGRCFQDGGKWFYLTREGTAQGPFETSAEADASLEYYIQVMSSGFMPADCELDLQPMELKI